MTPELILVGASGYTGRLVASALAARGVPFVATARDEERLRGELGDAGLSHVPTKRVDVTDPADLAWLARPGHVVMSCVGPFSVYGRALARAVADGGATYVDVTGEEPFVAWSADELDERARDTGALLLHSCAFESFPACVLAAALCPDRAQLSEIASYYRIPGHRMSPGTNLTMRLASRFPTARFADGRFVPAAATLDRPITLPFLPGADVAVFAPYPEIRLWPRVHATRSAISYLALPRSEARLLAASKAKPPAREPPSAEAVIARHTRRARPGPTAAERAEQAFAVGVVATHEDGHAEAAHLTGVDPYGLTAEIAAWVSAELLADPSEGGGLAGVRSPSERFGIDDFLETATAWQPRLTFGRGPV